MLSLVFLSFLVACIICYLLTPVVIKFAGKAGIIDDPKTHKHVKVVHTTPTPRGGGIPIFLGILVSALIFLPLDKHLVGILMGGLTIAILGFLDDRLDLSPYKRLLIQFLVAGMPIAAGIGIAFIQFPILSVLVHNIPSLGFIPFNEATGAIDLSFPRITFNFLGEHSIWILADIFALLWIVTLMNFINMGASGIDGQLSGTTVVTALSIAALSLKYSADITEWPVIILASITAGAYFGFLPWHAFPQKIMPGFGGSTLAGFMLGVLSILSTAKVGALLVILAVPLVDTGFTIIRRVISGKSPFWGDRGHLHHRLLDAGFSKKQIAFFYWGITALLGIVAINLNAAHKLYTILGIVVALGGIILWLTKNKK